MMAVLFCLSSFLSLYTSNNCWGDLLNWSFIFLYFQPSQSRPQVTHSGMEIRGQLRSGYYRLYGLQSCGYVRCSFNSHSFFFFNQLCSLGFSLCAWLHIRAEWDKKHNKKVEGWDENSKHRSACASRGGESVQLHIYFLKVSQIDNVLSVSLYKMISLKERKSEGIR